MNHLHIVSFNVPWPADYGGVIDVYYRIKALADAGVKIHLHCYTYGRAEAVELAKICEEVHYYPREIGWRHQLEFRPYIVASRNSKQLISNLSKDNYPILLEGLHNGFVLEKLGGKLRKISVRAHNVEHDYYQALAHAESCGWKKLFFFLEAYKLRRYEPILKSASNILAISEKDAEYFRSQGYQNVLLLSPSHGHQTVTSQLGKGDYVLYHGNLSVGENVRAVEYLLEKIVPENNYKFIIAGRNPAESLKLQIAQHPRVELIENPDDLQMHHLLQNAQVNLLVTDQATGVKLKLVNALYEGRHCLASSKMVEGTDLDSACHIADTVKEMNDKLSVLMETEFDTAELQKRKKIMENDPNFDLLKNIIL